MIELKGKYNKDCKIFNDNIEESAYSLIQNILDEKATRGVPVRIMPDVHTGVGIVIGFTCPMTNYVNPDWVGCDIGCGVETHRINLECRTEDLNLQLIDSQIRSVIPMGDKLRNKSVLDDKEFLKKLKKNVTSFHSKYTEHTGINYDLPTINEKWLTSTLKRYHMEPQVFYKSIGTLGGGNHFIEIGMDTSGFYWLTIHSGSRNLGIRVWKYHTNQAKLQKDNNDPEYSRELEKIKNSTEDRNKLPKMIEDLRDKMEVGINKKFLRGEFLFNYLIDMIFAQTYAEFNRDAMRLEICKKLNCVVMDSVKSIHNYIDFDDFTIRKGAISSYEGERLVIPFSMKDGLIIGEGKSNGDWNNSAPHGAGRVLARGKAKSQLSMNEFQKEMEGIYSTSVVPETLDESPMAYKNPELIELLIDPTVKVINKVRPILNIKSID